MTLWIRLTRELTRRLARAAQASGQTRSELIRQWIEECLDRREANGSAWELGKDLFGRHFSGRSDLSTRRRAILGEKVRDRKARRR